MATRREQILAALHDQLEELTNVRVYRSRSAPIVSEFEQTSGITLRPLAEQVEQGIGYATRDLEVRVDVFERGDVPDQKADALVQRVHDAVMQDTRLAGIAVNIEEVSTEWDFEDADWDGVAVRITYRITYRSQIKDLAAAGP